MLTAIEQVRSHLRTMGIKIHCKLNPKATMRDVDNANSRIGLALPESYVEFITQVANGFELSWRSKEKKGPFASFEMTSLDASIDGMLGMREWRFYDDTAAAAYGFPYVDDSALAIETNKRMHNWLPIHPEGNGDNFSIDLESGGKLILDQHDWLDGGTGDNGFLMASDLPSFLESWANVCFSYPQGLWWKSVIGSDGVTWTSDEFDNRFRISQ